MKRVALFVLGLISVTAFSQSRGDDEFFVGYSVEAGRSGSVAAELGHYSDRRIGPGFHSQSLELGIVGSASDKPVVGRFSANYDLAFSKEKDLKFPSHQLFATAGYTRVFASENVLNYGLGVTFRSQLAINGCSSAYRVEARDYRSFNGEHTIVFRFSRRFDLMIDEC